MAVPDIIIILVFACLIIGAFAIWEWHLERRNRTPPLLPLSIFTLDRGRVALLFVITVSIPSTSSYSLGSMLSPSAKIFCFSGYSNFMYVTTLYFQEYLHLSLRKTSVSTPILQGTRASNLYRIKPFRCTIYPARSRQSSHHLEPIHH